MDLEFEQLQDLVLLSFWESARRELRNGGIFLGAGSISDDVIMVDGVSEFMMKKAVEGLIDRRMIRKIDSFTYEISARGISYLEKARAAEGSFLSTSAALVLAENHGDTIFPSFLYEVKFGRSNKAPENAIPASDRTVTLNHNQSDYQQAVEALDRVLEEFRNDHRLDNVLGPQKEAHLKVLEGGRKALEDKEISVENGQNWIVAPLKWIAEKFADGALKVLAVKALEAIAKLF